jgi:excisionase family DNA binding protein
MQMQGNRKSSSAETTVASPVAAASLASSEILIVAEVAALLKVPPSSIYEWTRFRGTQRIPLPHRKVGKYLRFLRSEVDAWLVGLPKARNTQKRRYIKKDAAQIPAAPVKATRRRRAA